MTFDCPCGRKFMTEEAKDLHILYAHSLAQSSDIGVNLIVKNDPNYVAETLYDEWEQRTAVIEQCRNKPGLWQRIRGVLRLW